jgi:hypothetical protein
MYYDTISHPVTETEYFKFFDPFGRVFLCTKVDKNNNEEEISHVEYEQIKIEIDRGILKYMLYCFLNSKQNNTMIVVKQNSIETMINNNNNITKPNMIKYFEFGNIIEKNISSFDDNEIDNLVSFLHNNNITKLFIDHCVEKMGDFFL